MATVAQDDRRIYVASLSDYNAGRLHGRWIDATQSAEEISDEVAAMLAASPEPVAEEWAIHDYEGFGSYRVSEWESFEAVATIAQGIDEHGTEPVTAWLAYTGEEWDDDAFTESYAGEWASLADFAQQLAEDIGAIDPNADYQWPRSYIDWDAAARDLVLGGDYWAHEAHGSVYVFRSV